VAVFTNLTPNHLDRHKTFDAYVEAKAGIFARARAAVLNAADPESMDRFGRLEIPTLFFSSHAPVEEGLYLSDGYIVERNQGHEERLLAVERVDLPGLFNLENLMAALAGVRLIREQEADYVPKAAVNAGAAFEGVPHRLEMVATLAGVRYINDSIATTPESCLAALDAVEGTIHLIAGGYDKGLPLDRLAQAIIKSVSTVFLVGETGRALEKAILKAAEDNGCQCPLLRPSGSLKSAVNEATHVARSGSTVLLSPGFASYDQFLNFEERGESFRRFVNAL
jgi:UDP-N-acetylmuramoylalanine--D-glutamate ligase